MCTLTLTDVSPLSIVMVRSPCPGTLRFAVFSLTDHPFSRNAPTGHGSPYSAPPYMRMPDEGSAPSSSGAA